MTFNAGQGTIHVGSSGTSGSGTVYLSNATIANYLASLAGTSTFALAATNSIYVDNSASIAAGSSRNVTLTAGGQITFAGNTLLSGNVVTLNAGSTGILSVNAAYSGGAVITTQSPLVLNAAQVMLTSNDNIFIGNASTDANATNGNAAGFIDNAAIARYVAALRGAGLLSISAATATSTTTSLTVDASARINATIKDGNSHSTANGVNIALTAATLTIAAGAVIDAQAANAPASGNTPATTFTSGTVTISASWLDGTVPSVVHGGTLTIGGTIKGSSVVLSAGGITVAGGASLIADTAGSVSFGFWNNETVNNTTGNNGSNGTLSNNVIATYMSALQSGETFVLSALGSHTLSLAATAVIDGGTTINVALSSKALTVALGAQIITPRVGFGFAQDDVDIGPTGDVTNAGIANMILAAAAADTFIFNANNSITLEAGAIIDGRFLNVSGFSQRNALNITLNAPNITIAQNAQILAQAVNNGTSTHFTNGDVSLTATASQTLLSGLATATTGITVDGMIAGRDIIIKAASSATSNMNTATAAGFFASVAETLGSTILGINGGYVAANTVAKVAINTHANLNASRNVLITAHGTQDAEDPVVSVAILVPFGASAVVGQVTADVSTIVSGNASITAGGGILIAAATDTTLNVSALSVTTKGVFLATSAIGQANIKTETTVNAGATLVAGSQGVQVSANNYSTFSVSATALAFTPLLTTSDSGGVGGAVAVSQINVSTTATMGANFGSSGAYQTGDLLVVAASDIAKNATSASVTLGSPGLLAAIFNAGAGASEGFADLASALLTPIGDIKLPFKVAGSLALATTSESSTATIAAVNGGSAPHIYTTGDVAVISQLIDDQIRNNSSSTVNVSSAEKGPSIAVAAAIAFGEFTHNSNAYVGANVIIHAADIGVAALTTTPNTNSWEEWDGSRRRAQPPQCQFRRRQQYRHQLRQRERQRRRQRFRRRFVLLLRPDRQHHLVGRQRCPIVLDPRGERHGRLDGDDIQRRRRQPRQHRRRELLAGLRLGTDRFCLHLQHVDRHRRRVRAAGPAAGLRQPRRGRGRHAQPDPVGQQHHRRRVLRRQAGLAERRQRDRQHDRPAVCDRADVGIVVRQHRAERHPVAGLCR